LNGRERAPRLAWDIALPAINALRRSPH
jgi:hypothetical protein